MVTVSVPAITAYASAPSSFQNPISYDRCSYETPRSLRHFSTSASQLAGAFRVQPAIRCDAINYNGAVPKNVPEKLDILGVEAVDVIVDKGLDFSRAASHDILQSRLNASPIHGR